MPAPTALLRKPEELAEATANAPVSNQSNLTPDSVPVYWGKH